MCVAVAAACQEQSHSAGEEDGATLAIPPTQVRKSSSSTSPPWPGWIHGWIRMWFSTLQRWRKEVSRTKWGSELLPTVRMPKEEQRRNGPTGESPLKEDPVSNNQGTLGWEIIWSMFCQCMVDIRPDGFSHDIVALWAVHISCQPNLGLSSLATLISSAS